MRCAHVGCRGVLGCVVWVWQRECSTIVVTGGQAKKAVKAAVHGMEPGLRTKVPFAYRQADESKRPA